MANKKIIKITLLLLALGIIIAVTYDYFWNGKLVLWFYDNFMVFYENGAIEPNWLKLKSVLISIFLFVNPALFLSFVLYGKYTAGKQRAEFQKVMLQIIHGTETVSLNYPEYSVMNSELLKLKLENEHQKELYEKEAARKNDLITYLAHDLKTPLASVIGYLSFLDEAGTLPEEQKAKFTGIALDKAYRLESLIDQFFEITRFNLQTIIINKEKADLQLMLRQLADEFYPLAQAQHKTISIDIHDRVSIYIDPDKFGRVLNNILKNALAYSYENTAIHISEYIKDNLLFIKISNQGDPIPSHKLDMIFEKFYRLDNSRSSLGGAGLGLAIAKAIMEAHHGTICAASDENATIFTLTLPL